jgi:CelD/BcsL family acetyltransferase involved in cellulose biosynthesis
MIDLDVQKQSGFDNFNRDIYSSFTEELQGIWTDFENKFSWNPFYTYPWISHWQSIVGGPLHQILPQIVVVKKDDTILGIFPFAISRRQGVKVLEWLGGIHADYTGPLLHPDFNQLVPNFSDLWDELLKLLPPCDVIHLRRQPEMLGDIENPFVKSFNVLAIENAYRATLSGTWEEYYSARIKKKIRADSRRQRNRLEEQGVVQFKVAASASDANMIIKNMMIQKSQRYQDTGVTDMLAIKEHRDFYLGLPKQNFSNFQLHCSALMVDENMVATHVGLVSEKCFFYLMPAHQSGDWHRYSPGRLLLENLLEWAYEHKISIFDFTVGAEQYKKEWCDVEMKLFEYLQPLNYKGRYYAFLQSLIKKLFQNKGIWNFLKRVNSLRNNLTLKKG